ncbi:MAG: TRAP-type transport system large permease protein [Thermoanaerobacteraceae bacterium]|nr:TRAP-type transport system large permease protein [Thermoanaerobacteraceae bacterium]
MALGVFLGTLLVFLAIGVPIAFSLVICAVALMYFLNAFNPQIIAQNMVGGANNFPLLAIPFFMLAGEIMGKGGLSQYIVEFANLVVGRVRGGLGYAAILASMIFAGLSGAAVADTAAIGGILLPMMVNNGYGKARSTGLICASALLAPIIPPSLPMIILGVTTGLSIGDLFMVGLVPGVIMGLILMITWSFIVRKEGYDSRVSYTKEEAIKILKKSLPALVLPLIILIGIRFGVFTPTEAGSVAVVYAFLVSTLYYKELKAKDIPGIFVEAGKSTAVVVFVAAAAMAVAWLLTIAQIPDLVVSLFGGIVHKPLLLIFAINLLLLGVGMVMDITPAIMILAPVLFPLIKAAGIHPIYFGLIMVLNLVIGLITPPVGVVLYVGTGLSKISLTDLVKAILPFMLAEAISLLLFILFPDLVMIPFHLITGK